MVIEIEKKTRLAPLTIEKQYLFHSEIIAMAIKDDNPGIIYYDIDNRLDLWSWSCVEKISILDKYIIFHGINNLVDSIYSSVKINKEKIKYIIPIDDKKSQIVMVCKNLFFISNNSIENTVDEINIDLKTADVPLLGKCYINTDHISKIQKEDYITIDPEDVSIYLNNINKAKKDELFHIVFKDSSELTILGSSIENVLNNIGEKLI